MTIDEAIKYYNNGLNKEHKQLAEWLEELKRMRKKFLTKKTVEGLGMDEEPECPNCGQYLDMFAEDNYCHSCGQALSWDYVEEEDEQ